MILVSSFKIWILSSLKRAGHYIPKRSSSPAASSQEFLAFGKAFQPIMNIAWDAEILEGETAATKTNV